MSVRHVLLALLVCAPLLRGAEQELSTLKGESIKGEVVSITDEKVVYEQGGKRVTVPTKEVLKIDFREAGKPGEGTTYAQLELTDGSLFSCSKWTIKEDRVEMTLLTGQALKLPVKAVRSVMNDAQVEKNRTDWARRLARKPKTDVLVYLNKSKNLDSIPCTLGEADGKVIKFVADDEGEAKEGRRELSDVHGLIFRRALDPKAPAVSCKVLDTQGDVVFASSATLKEGALTLKTPAGATVELKADTVAVVDYTKGRFEYLSELEPAKVVARSNVEDGDKPEQQHVYKDVSFTGRDVPIKVAGKGYKKGLVLRPYAELVYDLKGDFRGFSAVVGLQDNVSVEGTVVLVVEGDGTVIRTIELTAKSRPVKLDLNIKDVQRLRLVAKVPPEEWFDLGKHVNLADAKVSK
jgi:hypothetical protein